MPEPKTGPGEAKVRVVATSINPIDWKLREGDKRPGMALDLPVIVRGDPMRGGMVAKRTIY